MFLAHWAQKLQIWTAKFQLLKTRNLAWLGTDSEYLLQWKIISFGVRSHNMENIGLRSTSHLQIDLSRFAFLIFSSTSGMREF